MNVVTNITSALRLSLCAPMEVTAVPVGYHVGTGFPLPDGDLLSFYLIPVGDGRFWLEDDGTTLPNAIASGFDIKSPNRENLLRSLLSDEGASYDSDLAIRSTAPVDAGGVGAAAMHFISALIRTRDLFMVSRENVAASFSEDVRSTLVPRLPDDFEIDEAASNEPGSPDVVLRNRATGLKVARIYAAGGDLRLMDALVEYQSYANEDSPIIAVVDRRKNRVSERRFNTATNLGLNMAVVGDTGEDWVRRVLQVAAAASASESTSRPH